MSNFNKITLFRYIQLTTTKMKTLICLVFAMFIFVFVNANAQESASTSQQKISIDNNTTVQQLSGKIIDQYGLKNLKFMKLENGNYVPLRNDEVKDVYAADALDTTTIIIILAVIGAIAVILFIFR